MKIMYQYTLRALRMNRTRTIVTIIGIILSVALFTAVTEGAYSGQQFYIRLVEQDTGSYHVYFRDLTAEQLDALEKDGQIDQVAALDTVGYADVCSQSDGYPYLYIGAMGQNLTDMLPIQLLDGRMPENERELLLPSNLADRGQVHLATGDEITLDVGQRQWEGQTLGQGTGYWEGECLTNITRQTYTVVGHYERLPYVTEGYDAPGFLAFTGGKGSGSYTAYVTLSAVKDVEDFAASGEYGDDYAINSELLRAYGQMSNGNFVKTLYMLVAILLLLISAGSVLLIYNAFSISVSDRTRQFGLLKSIGATKRQIRQSVLFEALALCVIGIPLGLLLGCAGIGLTLFFLKDQFAAFLLGSIDTTVSMEFVLGSWPLLVAAGVGLVTVLISAWIPARRATKITVIDAVRRTRDIKIPSRRVKTSKLTQKLFGLEGTLATKNYKRSRKTYRATIISLCMSIVLFVSVSAFTSYLTQTVEVAADDGFADIVCSINCYNESTPSVEEIDALYQKMAQVDGLSSHGYEITWNVFTEQKELFSQDYADCLGQDEIPTIVVSFVSDNVFRQLAEENKLNLEAYYQEDAPLGILYNRIVGKTFDDDNYRYYDVEVFHKNAFPGTIRTEYMQRLPEDAENSNIDGSMWTADEKGDVFEAHYQLVPIELSVGAVMNHAPDFGSVGANIYPCIYYPVSMMEAVMGQAELECCQLFFFADNHKSAYNDLLQVAMDNAPDMGYYLEDMAENYEAVRGLVTVLNVFSYGLIIMISLIAAVNVFNTVSTNIALRRREFAMLQSIGMTNRSLRKMLNYECLVYGLRALLYGVPISLLFTWLIYRAVGISFEATFAIPWKSLAIAAASVFLVVFVTMLYSMQKLRKESTVETLKNENI